MAATASRVRGRRFDLDRRGPPRLGEAEPVARRRGLAPRSGPVSPGRSPGFSHGPSSSPERPLILGLRRTLPVGLIEAALGRDREPRAAVLAAIGLGLAFVGREPYSWPGAARGRHPRTWTSPQVVSKRTPAWRLLPLAAWAAFGASARCSGWPPRPWASTDRAGFASTDSSPWPSDGEAVRSLRDGAWLGVGASLRGGPAGLGLGPPRSRATSRDPASWPSFLPPLVLGLGVFLLPGLLDAGDCGQLEGRADRDRDPSACRPLRPLPHPPGSC